MKYSIQAISLLLFTSFALTLSAQENRIEKDLLGEKKVPTNAYYGIQAARAMENFQISHYRISDYPKLIEALALVKLAAAKANADSGALDKEKLTGIDKACRSIMEGNYHDQFDLDMFQGGAGTSTNMAANEVIANVALEMMGKPLGDYHSIEPHDDLNMSQSTNDFYPTALKVAFVLKNEILIGELEALVASLEAKGAEYNHLLKMGRTEMQDAVPMTLGQEFYAFANALKGDIAYLEYTSTLLHTHNMGGTAIGTKLNAEPGFTDYCSKHLSQLTGKSFVAAKDLIAATTDTQGFVAYSSALKALATRLSKISSDLILLSSGPRTGIFEINLPALQPGSSIMPGKVNPVIPEATAMVAAQVIGNDSTITIAGQSGNFELNVMLPVIAYNLLNSIKLLSNSSTLLAEKAIASFTVRPDNFNEALAKNPILVTALNPLIGYAKAAEIAKLAYKENRPIIDVAAEHTDLSRSELEVLLEPTKLTYGGL